jgi:adenine-specific DNA-methyltransferase
MKGFVPTPSPIVDRMVERLFKDRRPTSQDVVLDPGCGRGEFISGVLKWCLAHEADTPTIVGVENDPQHWGPAHDRFQGNKRVKIRRRDFLKRDLAKYDFVIGNPPYVPITGLSQKEKEAFKGAGFATASGRMDLYMLFFEAAIKRLRPGGKLVFITPEKFLYVETGTPLRKILAGCRVEEVELLPEDSFPGLVTYPAITSVLNETPQGKTKFRLRGGKSTAATLPTDGSSWLPQMQGYPRRKPGPTLKMAALRISAGIATGADSVFIVPRVALNPGLVTYAYPTLAGRQLRRGAALPHPSSSMLVPYRPDGRLREPEEMPELLEYLGAPSRKSRLTTRTCASRKAWYAFHDSAPIAEITRPKILWKDISEKPVFWVDRKGLFVPRHSVYYLVPKDSSKLDEIADYLSSEEAEDWIRAHCQRAANGFLRLQSKTLRELPIPSRLMPGA